MNVAPIVVVLAVVTSLATAFSLLVRSKARVSRMVAAEAGDKHAEARADRLVNGWPYLVALFGLPFIGLFTLVGLLMKDFLPAGSWGVLLGCWVLPVVAAVFVSLKERQYQERFGERFKGEMQEKMKQRKARARG